MDSDRDGLEMVKGAADAGGAGVSMGRNVFQHKNPTALVKAFSAIINEGASVDAAMEIMRAVEKGEA